MKRRCKSHHISLTHLIQFWSFICAIKMTLISSTEEKERTKKRIHFIADKSIFCKIPIGKRNLADFSLLHLILQNSYQASSQYFARIPRVSITSFQFHRLLSLTARKRFYQFVARHEGSVVNVFFCTHPTLSRALISLLFLYPSLFPTYSQRIGPFRFDIFSTAQRTEIQKHPQFQQYFFALSSHFLYLIKNGTERSRSFYAVSCMNFLIRT